MNCQKFWALNVLLIFQRMSSENEEDIAQRLTSNPDCQPCRFTGTTAAFAIGTYILYHTRGGFYANQPIQKLCMRVIAAGKCLQSFLSNRRNTNYKRVDAIFNSSSEWYQILISLVAVVYRRNPSSSSIYFRRWIRSDILSIQLLNQLMIGCFIIASDSLLHVMCCFNIWYLHQRNDVLELSDKDLLKWSVFLQKIDRIDKFIWMEDASSLYCSFHRNLEHIYCIFSLLPAVPVPYRICWLLLTI